MFGKLITNFTALQQEGYQIGRFLNWLIKNPFQSSITSKKPLVWTEKAKSILLSAIAIWIFIVSLSYFLDYRFCIFLIFLGVWQPGIFLALGVVFRKPYEIWNRIKVVNQSKKYFESRPDIRVVGITGSFGKTSVKDFLFEIVKKEGFVVKTPESYNTVFGIKKVIDFEITNKTKTFLCEMGAYKRGEIAELCKMVQPTYAILTAVGTQHLERFGSLENTTLGKFELIDVVDPRLALVNLDNELIARKVSEESYKYVKTYSLENKTADFYVESKKITGGLTSFNLNYRGEKFLFSTRLFGSSNLSNLVGAIGMAFMLKVPYKQIEERVSSLVPSPHRLELKRVGKSTIIDDAFSSNEQGFANVIQDLKLLSGRKALITPGIVELGNKTEEVHQKLGELVSEVFDEVYLVGKSERTLALADGMNKRTKYSFIENNANLWSLVYGLAKQYDWILLENDLTDIY